MNPQPIRIHATPIIESIEAFAGRLKRRETSALDTTNAYLQQIQALDPTLNAYTHVAVKEAQDSARRIDALLAGGSNLGPLTGVPVAIKDLFTVEGMPTTGGSRLDVSDLVEPEGPFIRKLKEAGCIVLGKTRSTEFAMGTFNLTHPTPWNPCDLKVKRMPGGSSNGSAVALAADMCAFAIGSDTGGSVRLPAALCGTFGYKASADVWPLDGVFPLAPSMDSIGTFSRSAADACLIYSALTEQPVPELESLRGLRLGRPTNYFFDDLHPRVRAAMDDACRRLEEAGVVLIDVHVPGGDELPEAFGLGVPAEALAFLGRERVLAHNELIDPVAWSRMSRALDYPADRYLRAMKRRAMLQRAADEMLSKLDGLITPTSPAVAVPTDSCTTVDDVLAWNGRSLRNTQPFNLLGLCAASLPLLGETSSGDLPVGLQLAARHGADVKLLSMARALESALRQGASQRRKGAGQDLSI